MYTLWSIKAHIAKKKEGELQGLLDFIDCERDWENGRVQGDEDNEEENFIKERLMSFVVMTMQFSIIKPFFRIV